MTRSADPSVTEPSGAERAPETVLRLSGITKRFGALTANDAIDLDLRRGEILALLGENGAGKTTLMSILFGHYVADEGRIEVFGHPLPAGSPKAAIAAGLGMVHQHFTLAENLSVLDNVTIGTEPLWKPGRDRAGARRRIAELGQRFGLAVDPDARVGALSVGERQKVEILKALYRDARILILDEPTAVLTPQESERLFVTLRAMVADGLSIIFISHKLPEVMAVSDRVAVLRAGRMIDQRPAAGLDRATLAELMVGRKVSRPRHTAANPGAPALVFDRVSATGAGSKPKLHEVSLTVHAGEIVGIAGVSGNGQSLLADLAAGMARVEAGRLTILDHETRRPDPAAMVRLGVGRIPEDRHAEGLVGDMNVWENVIAERRNRPAFSRWGFLRRSKARAHAAELVSDFEVRCPSVDATVRQLSGGNMQKLILGRALALHPGLILANQPTRGLDIGAVAYVHQRLLEARDGGAAILLISEDLDEILALSDRVAVIHAGHLTPARPRAEVTVSGLGLLMAGAGDPDAGDPHPTTPEAAHAS
ncbi:ABC transporter ATP-binding protein [Tistrella mobilis]|uniref:ABC transporter ATP-binding protein n=1 Tax=Tistrella mobilis TaxID=171437 RepID=UPI002636AB28|nr:ABC transporter ATP-binding protein [uncultured Tistrella sp.]